MTETFQLPSKVDFGLLIFSKTLDSLLGIKTPPPIKWKIRKDRKEKERKREG